MWYITILMALGTYDYNNLPPEADLKLANRVASGDRVVLRRLRSFMILIVNERN